MSVGLECYSCISSSFGWDDDCETGNTTNLEPVECPDTMKYCYYTRTQWNNISWVPFTTINKFFFVRYIFCALLLKWKGGANSILRSCTQEPQYLRNGQQDLEGGNLTIWYKACTMDLCNDANFLAKGNLIFKWYTELTEGIINY